MYGDIKTAQDRTGRKIEKKWSVSIKILLTIIMLMFLLGAMHADYQALQMGLIS